MRIKKLTSTLVIAVLTVSTLVDAEVVCINCKANIKPMDVPKKSITTNKFKATKRVQAERLLDSDDFISLDDNEVPSGEIIILDTIEEKMETPQKLLACDDTYKLVCDNIKKVCECV
jgi:hypothetical protein